MRDLSRIASLRQHTMQSAIAALRRKRKSVWRREVPLPEVSALVRTHRLGTYRHRPSRRRHGSAEEPQVKPATLHYMNYNFCRIHKSLRITPAMAAGVTDRLWEIGDIVKVLGEREAAS